MKNYSDPVYLHEQKFFTDWLKSIAKEWPADPIEQEDLVALFHQQVLSRMYETEDDEDC